MRKKTAIEKEKDNFLSKKQMADQRWNRLMGDIQDGKKIDHQDIAHAMDECNLADIALIQRNLFRH